MSRIKAIDRRAVVGKTKERLDELQDEYGMIPNIFLAMANAPAVLEGYLACCTALRGGVLPASLREQIALAVSESNHAEYCLAAHAAIGRSIGLSEETIADARKGFSTNRGTEAVLRFAQELVTNRGRIKNEDFTRLRNAGYQNDEIIEVIANVAMTLFTNYFNQAIQTDSDLPAAPNLAYS